MSTETRDAPETIADLIDHLRITHGRVRRTYRRPDGCATCHVDWPCPVARLFAALRATDVPVAEGLRDVTPQVSVALGWVVEARSRVNRGARASEVHDALDHAADSLRRALATPEPDA